MIHAYSISGNQDMQITQIRQTLAWWLWVSKSGFEYQPRNLVSATSGNLYNPSVSFPSRLWTNKKNLPGFSVATPSCKSPTTKHGAMMLWKCTGFLFTGLMHVFYLLTLSILEVWIVFNSKDLIYIC